MSNINWVSVVQHVFTFFVLLATIFGVVSVYYDYSGELQKAKLYLWSATIFSVIATGLTVTYLFIR